MPLTDPCACGHDRADHIRISFSRFPCDECRCYDFITPTALEARVDLFSAAIALFAGDAHAHDRPHAADRDDRHSATQNLCIPTDEM